VWAYPNTRWVTRWVADVAWLVGGFAVIALAWRFANEPHVVDNFSFYVFEANGRRPVTFQTWTSFRLEILANTFVPFRMFAVEAHNVSLNSFYGPSPSIDRFSFSYFATLPFGVGFLYYPVYLTGLVVFARRATLLFVAAIVVPFLVFIVYWGSSVDPLRNGIQFLFVIAVLAAFLGHSVLPRREGPLGSVWWARVVQATASAHAVEVLFMLMVPTVVTAGVPAGSAGVLSTGLFLPTDVVALLVMVFATIGLGGMTWYHFDPSRIHAEAGRSDGGGAKAEHLDVR
jgi:hypothetical protein